MQRLFFWPKRNQEYLWIITCLFAIGVTLGAFVHSATLDSLMQASLQSLKRIQETYVNSGAGPLTLVLIILKNNLLVALLICILGTFFAIVPIILIIENGLTIGYVVTHAANSHHISILKVVLYGVMPHGIFEIPAILFAGALGIKLGSTWIRPLRSNTRLQSYVITLKEVLLVGPIVLVLLVVAAVIEGFVTPQLLHGVILN